MSLSLRTQEDALLVVTLALGVLGLVTRNLQLIVPAVVVYLVVLLGPKN